MLKTYKPEVVEAYTALDEQFPDLCTLEEYDAFSVETITVLNKLVTIINSKPVEEDFNFAQAYANKIAIITASTIYEKAYTPGSYMSLVDALTKADCDQQELELVWCDKSGWDV